MNIFQKESLKLKNQLLKELGNSFNVNQFPSCYPKPNGKLLSVSSSTAIFQCNTTGKHMQVPHFIAENIIWGA